MSDEEKQPSGKKLKVIEWHMADPPPDDSEPLLDDDSNRGKKPLIWKIVGAVIVLFLLFIGIRGFQVYQEIQVEIAEAQTRQSQSFEPGAPLTETFVSRPKAELAREDVLKRLRDARRTIDGNPIIMQRLLTVEKSFQKGERLLQGRDYAASYTQFEQTRDLLDEFNTSLEARGKAAEANDDWLVLFNKYEPHRNLDPEAYEEAFALASEGRFFMQNGSFAEAHERFEAAIAKLEGIGELLAEFVDRQVLEGQAALAAGNSQAAIQKFNTVIEIEPDNEAALQGLKRAESLDQVYPLVQEARELEEDGMLVEANELYARAFELDNLAARAQQGMFRTARLVKDQAFNQAMTKAGEAAEAGNWFDAVEAYEEALEIYPKNEEVSELLAEAEDMEFQTRVILGLNKAIEFENARDWDLAKDAYQEVLDIDPDNQEATEGMLRTGKMIRTLIRYEKMVELALLEARAGDFQSAIRYFNNAMGVKPDYLALNAEAKRLRDFLDQQSKPVKLTLLSDDRTWVSIYGYELLGKFEEQTVNILPGRYRIIGRRKGYEDVTIDIQVVAGEPMEPINVVASRKVG
ncbi:MAG: tetratricopeptide repeat protein [Opitutales bacterium]